MKHTNFFDIHKRLGAKIVSFAGFEMPIQYPKGILQEHMAVRERAGIFDVSHMGEVEVRGADALAFIQKISINDASKLEPGKAQYSAMCYPDGGVVDDMLVYHCGDYYMLVINGSNVEKDVAWMRENAEGFDIQLDDISDDISLLAIQGPRAIEILQPLTEANLNNISYYSFTTGELATVPMIISRTGYTGELGFELYFRGDQATAEAVWNAIMDAGASSGIEPVGLGARDTLRLEKGYCLYGNDIDQTTNPLEAGLGWITKINKGEFNGKEAIVRTKEEGPKRKLVGLKVQADKFIARHGYPVTANGEEVGTVTSGNISPILNTGIAMGYVRTDLATPGTIVNISARGKEFAAEVVKPPFL